MGDRGKNRIWPVAILVGEDGFDIGINGTHYIIHKNYAVCLERLGVVPFLAYDIRNVEDYVAFADILCLTGGVDIHPGWYHAYYRDSAEMEELSQSRDNLDFALCQRFIEEKKPILAIGRGMQVVNVALGGTLCQDIEKETKQKHCLSDSKQKHLIWATKHSVLSEVCGDNLLVNSYHHQGVATLGTGLTAVYQAEDGTIEAFVHNDLPILGVQWHPEQADWNGERQIEVFQAFGKWIGLWDQEKEEVGEGKTEKEERNIDKRKWEKERWNKRKWDRREGKKENINSRVEKPLVLVNGGAALDRQFQGSSWVANQTYPSAVSAAGGVPLMPLVEEVVEEYACLADALILTGSISFVPKKELKKRLQQEEFSKKESFDQALFWSFYRERKPILGICLGHQMINCYLGGTLEENFKFRTGVEHMMHQHLIWVDKESILYPLFGEVFWVNSRHNDKIDIVADELYVTAWSKDGVVEAFEHMTLPIYGVEWHPERMRGDFREPPKGPDMTKLFAWFIRKNYIK